jgi:aspartyl-tRNA(Asn)/glutamyl-tRNA(Gln) amidotransferase subunit A
VAELWERSAADLAAAIRAGEASAEEVVRALLGRIDRLEPRLRAWATVDEEGALAAARVCDARRGAESALPPLLGVPFGAKDIFYSRGLRTGLGTDLFDRFVPDYDAVAIERLRAAGAILLGKTVTTAFAYVDPPPTRNPWDASRTPGGSSSGAAAAVAARMVPASLGTQTAGSVLRPAAYCGTVGLKPSFGRISRHGVFPAAWSLDTVGVLTRTVEDAALFLEAMAGHDPRDPLSSPEPVDNYLAAVRHPLRAAPRLLVLLDVLDRASAVMRVHLDDLAGRLVAAGAELREARLPLDLDLALAAHHVTMQTEMAATHSFLLARHTDRYPPRIRAYVQTGQLLPGAAYVHAQRLRRRLRAGVDDLFAQADALLVPAVSDQAPDTSTTGDPTCQAIFTFLGLPAIALPTGLSPDGLPLSAQLVAPRFAETSLLATAHWVEQTVGFIGPPPLP